APLRIGGEVHPDDRTRAGVADERLHLLDRAVVGQVAHVESPVRGGCRRATRATRTTRTAAEAAAGAAEAVAPGWLLLEGTHADRLAALERAVERLACGAGFLGGRQRDEPEAARSTRRAILGEAHLDDVAAGCLEELAEDVLRDRVRETGDEQLARFF